MGVGVLDEIKAISAQLGLGFGLSLAMTELVTTIMTAMLLTGKLEFHYLFLIPRSLKD